MKWAIFAFDNATSYSPGIIFIFSALISNESSVIVGETDIEFTAYIKAENMKIIPGDYDVALSKAKIAHFINKKVQVQYWIALEADSTF